MFSFFIPNTSFKIPARNFGLLTTTIFKKTPPFYTTRRLSVAIT
jgi:hypothetical protein